MCVRKGEWDIDGELVKVEKLETMILNRDEKSDKKKGIIPIVWNLKESPINESDFEKLPGIYEIITKYSFNPKVKGRITVPNEAKLIKPIEFPKRNDGAILLLGAKETKLKGWAGITVYYCDTNLEGQNNDNVISRGIPIIEESIEGMKISMLKKCPDWYQVDITSVRGSNGIGVDKITNFTYIGGFNAKEITEQQEQTKPPGT